MQQSRVKQANNQHVNQHKVEPDPTLQLAPEMSFSKEMTDRLTDHQFHSGE
jgi:hypothetical protein